MAASACELTDSADEPSGSGSQLGPQVTPPDTFFIGGDGGIGSIPGLFFDGGFIGGPGLGMGGTPARLALLAPPAKTPPAISGGTLTVAADGSFAVAADPDRDAVHIRRANGGVTTVSLPAGSEPGRVAIDTAGRAHVALRSAGAVALLDLNAATVLAVTPVCAQPRGVSYDANSNDVSVACASGRLVTLDAANHALLAELLLDVDARDLVGDGAGGFKVSRYRSAELVSVAADGRTTARASAKGAQRAMLIPPPFDPATGVVSEPSRETLAPAVAWRTTAGPSGSTWMLHQQSLTDVVSETTTGGYGNSPCNAVTQAAVTEFDSAGRANRVLPVSMLGLSVDMAVSADGRWLAIASPGGYLQQSSTIQIADTTTATTEIPDFTCGGVGSMSDGYDAQTTAVAFDAAGLLYTFSREPATISTYRIDPAVGLVLVARSPVAQDSVRDTGHDMFHADVGTGLSCASCHGEATDDGHVWDFSSSGPRRTQNIRGGILASAPYHWSGDLSSVQKLLDEVMTKRMGGFAVEPQFADALGTWLDRQPQQATQPTASAAVTRGKLLFDSAQVACASCHAGPSLTNHESADVGTGGAFQIPSLLGVSLRPPYMHDGCAQTLDARFEPGCGGGDQHGFTSQLSGAQRADLVAYLGTL